MAINLADIDATRAANIYAEAEARAADILVESVTNKLAAAILADLKKDGPPPLPSNAQQARELLGALGAQLHQASAALFAAAERMKKHGDTYGASQAHAAGQRVRDAAQGVR